MAHYTVERLGTNELDEAWPIVRMSNAYANIDWWLSDAGQIIASGGGVLVARAPDDSIHGVATFQAPFDRTKESVLRIGALVTCEFSSSAPARSALLKELQRVAGKIECRYAIPPLMGRTAASCG